MREITYDEMASLLAEVESSTTREGKQLALFCRVGMGLPVSFLKKIFHRPTPVGARAFLSGHVALRGDGNVDFREMPPGSTFDGSIPLSTCPVCGKTCFTLGPTMNGLWEETGEESFAHVVEEMRPGRGGPVALECSRPLR